MQSFYLSQMNFTVCVFFFLGTRHNFLTRKIMSKLRREKKIRGHLHGWLWSYEEKNGMDIFVLMTFKHVFYNQRLNSWARLILIKIGSMECYSVSIAISNIQMWYFPRWSFFSGIILSWVNKRQMRYARPLACSLCLCLLKECSNMHKKFSILINDSTEKKRLICMAQYIQVLCSTYIWLRYDFISLYFGLLWDMQGESQCASVWLNIFRSLYPSIAISQLACAQSNQSQQRAPERCWWWWLSVYVLTLSKRNKRSTVCTICSTKKIFI